ncbi:MAG TPA: hypothetical protein VFQ07_11655 [Candidatus Polarisedimenticolia bacterium]|nr:hypothetical protein [Candidatus Polarisedimenticolia bacterium]
MLLALAAAAPLPAQTPAAAPVAVSVAPVTLLPGGRTEAKVTLDILRGVRIVAPGSEGRFLQPALLSFDAADGVYVEPASWPAGKGWHAEPEGPPIKVFEGRVELKVVVRAGPKVTSQDLTLKGRLRYQPIQGDDYKKPATLPVSLSVTVAAARPGAPAAAPKAKEPAATRP